MSEPKKSPTRLDFFIFYLVRSTIDEYLMLKGGLERGAYCAMIAANVALYVVAVIVDMPMGTSVFGVLLRCAAPLAAVVDWPWSATLERGHPRLTRLVYLTLSTVALLFDARLVFVTLAFRFSLWYKMQALKKRLKKE